MFLLLNELQEVYVATGEKSYSGTGRSRQVTRAVTPYSNYKLIPSEIDVVNSQGTSMKLYDKENVLSVYWAELETYSEFRIIVSGKEVRPLVVTKTGNKTVGAYLRYENAPGALVLLPYLDFNGTNFTRERKGERFWTKEAIQTAQQFVSGILSVDKALRQGGEFTPAPSWVSLEKFVLPKEQQITNKLLTLERQIEALQEEKEQLKQTLAKETELKRLLYEKGKLLEATIINSLKLMGFEAAGYRDSDSEFDVVFESPEGRLIGEAEGKDNKAINVDKLRQLEMNVQDDFARDEVREIAKAVLIGNAYRLSPPDDRTDFFTDKCLTAAKRSNTALVKTTDLFYISKYLSAKADKVFAERCRRAILNTVGVVISPNIPTE